MSKREFFPQVKKTVMTRPVTRPRRDILGQKGTAWAFEAQVYGDNYYRDPAERLLEIYDAGPAVSFYELLPQKEKYRREGLYLQTAIAYRTTENAFANIRTFSGNHVTLPNNTKGGIYIDPNNYYWVTDDLTLNVNSIYSGEKLWLQRVDWEWVSSEVVYRDEVNEKGIYLDRQPQAVEAVYQQKDITLQTVRDYLQERLAHDEHFTRRCLALLATDAAIAADPAKLFEELKLEPS